MGEGSKYEGGFVDFAKYERHKDVILANSTARQVMEGETHVRGLSDEELSAQLGLTLWEVREIRAIAKRDSVSLDDWRRAERQMQDKHETCVRKIAPRGEGE
jgi:hypothetical protein